MNSRSSGGGWFGLIVLVILSMIGFSLLSWWAVCLVCRVSRAYRDHRLSEQNQRLFQRSLLCAGALPVLLGMLNLIAYAFNPSVVGGLVSVGFVFGIGEFLAVCNLIDL